MRVKSRVRPEHTWRGTPIIDACYLGNDTWYLVLLTTEDRDDGKRCA